MVRTTRVAAYGVIRQDEALLLCRLSARVHDAAGKWKLPGGGLEFGERPEEAVVREVLEETGLEVVVGDLLGVDTRLLRWPGHAQHSVRIVYGATVVGGELRSEAEGTTDLAGWIEWGALDAIPTVSLVAAARGWLG